jgi:hypothetical protein
LKLGNRIQDASDRGVILHSGDREIPVPRLHSEGDQNLVGNDLDFRVAGYRNDISCVLGKLSVNKGRKKQERP